MLDFKQDINMITFKIYLFSPAIIIMISTQIKPRTLKNSKWGTPWGLNKMKFANLLTTLLLLLT